jgi:hypothetical protein
MDKLFLTLSLVFLTTFSFAQTVNFGIKAGLNLSTVAFNDHFPNFAVDPQNKTGFQAGVVADIGFQHFSIQPGLVFITKGQQFTNEFSTVSNNQTYSYHETGSERFNYLELPVNLLYKIQAAPGAKIHAGGGPYVGYGLSGTAIAHVSGSQTSDYTGPLTFGTDQAKDDFKLFDYGINLIAGVELKNHFTIDLNYGLGLKNISWGSGSDEKNRSLGLSVGYLF